MREKKPKEKKQSLVDIPDYLCNFLSEVYSLIENKDDLAITESDDLLQCERIYGGLIEENGDEYGFTFFPDDGGRNKWEFVLDSKTINQIATREKTKIKLWACQSPDCGCMFSDKNDLCFYCDFEEISM